MWIISKIIENEKEIGVSASISDERLIKLSAPTIQKIELYPSENNFRIILQFYDVAKEKAKTLRGKVDRALIILAEKQPTNAQMNLDFIINTENDLILVNKVYNQLNTFGIHGLEHFFRLAINMVPQKKDKMTATVQYFFTNSPYEFENYGENIMSNCLMASCKRSEQELKQRYQTLIPNRYNIQRIMEGLTNSILFIQNRLIAEGYLGKTDPNQKIASLTTYAKNLITKPQRIELVYKVNRAKFAFNVIIALVAISDEGVYGSNFEDLKKLVAFLYNVYIHNHNDYNYHNKNNFCINVDPHQALDSLINTLAMGARNKNRDEVDFDNIEEKSNPACEKGRYVLLFSGLNGVFPEIKLMYSWLEPMIAFLKSEIASKFVEQQCAKDLNNLKILHTYWSKQDPQEGDCLYHEYKQLKIAIISEFNNMIAKFINSYLFFDNKALMANVEQEIKEKINKFKNYSYGGSFVESISIDIATIEEAWQREFLLNPKKRLASDDEEVLDNKEPEQQQNRKKLRFGH